MKVMRILVFLSVAPALYLSAQEGADLATTEIKKAFPNKSYLTIAVMDFVNVNGDQSVLGRYFAEESAMHLRKKNGLRLVERSLIEKLEKEWDLGSTGVIAEDKIVEIGGMLSADALILGTLTLTGRRVIVHMRIVDTRTGVVLSTGKTELSGAKYIRMYNDILVSIPE